ncbi:LEPR-XLL domain-containing protein [Fibrobacter sp. UWH1]|nr:hypothetical protein B7992_16060 [Fibrobacter sp. UWH1]
MLSKQNKKNKKKYTFNNFSLEQLEPRMMMDGNLSIKKSPSRV